MICRATLTLDPIRRLRALAFVAGLLLFAQFAALEHVHADHHDEPEVSCQLCLQGDSGAVLGLSATHFPFAERSVACTIALPAQPPVSSGVALPLCRAPPSDLI